MQIPRPTIDPINEKVLPAANRDTQHWDRADAFDIARSPSGHVGLRRIHQCFGQIVARMEADALLKMVSPQVTETRLADEPVRWL